MCGIREATHNKKGLQSAMRGILEAGGNITEDWTVERVVAVGDQATGTTVLADLYQQMKAKAVHTDLDDLWRRLGVQMKNGSGGIRRSRAISGDSKGDYEAGGASGFLNARATSSNSLTRRMRQAA